MQTVRYCEADVNATMALHRNFHNNDIDREINRIRCLMDKCDDVQMREHYARRIARLKRRKI